MIDDTIRTNDPIIAESIGWIRTYRDQLTTEQKTLLREIIKIDEQNETQSEAIDANDEIQSLLRCLKGLRASVMDESGRVRADRDARDAKEVITSSTHLLSLLIKYEEKLDVMRRVKALEVATIEIVNQLNEKARRMFFARLEAELEDSV